MGLAKHISVSSHVALSRNAKDDLYLSLCKEVRAVFLITGDKDLLSISQEDLKKNGISCHRNPSSISGKCFLTNHEHKTSDLKTINKKVGPTQIRNALSCGRQAKSIATIYTRR